MKSNRSVRLFLVTLVLASGLGVVGTSPAPVRAVGGCAGKAYWTNGNGQKVEVVDLATDTSVAVISSVGASQRVAISPDGARAVVAGSSKATVIDTSTNQVINQITVGSTPLGVVFHPTQQTVYVASYGANAVYAINLQTNTVAATITGVPGAYGVAISPDGSKLYATATNGFSGAGSVKIIDTSNNTIIGSVTAGTGPVDIALNAAGSLAYVVNLSSASITKIDLSTNTATATWNLTAGSSPRGIALGASYLYVGLSASGKYSKVDLATGNKVDVTAGGTVQHVFLSPNGTRLYVSQNGISPRAVAPELEIFDTATDTSIGYVNGMSGSPNPTQGAVCPSVAPSGAPDIQLSSSTGTATAGTAVGSLYTISNVGWVQATSYSIAPAAPAGMTFNSSTGLLSGTPTSPQSSTTYTITAVNGGQTDTATFALTVNVAAPDISLSASSGSATVGSAVGSLYSISNAGGSVSSYAISPSLSAGLTFDTTTGLISGTPTVAQGPTTYTVTATNSTGSDTASIVLTISAAPAPTTTAPASTTSSSTSAPATPTTLVGASNAATVAASPGTGEALVDGKAVAVEILNVDVPAAAKEPELRSPAEVKEVQEAAKGLISELNALVASGEKAPVQVKETETGAELVGVAGVPVPVEDVMAVKTPQAAVLVAGTDSSGQKAAASDSGGVLEIVDGGQVATVAYGLTPGAAGELYILSTPTLLDSFTVAANGTFKRQAKLPPSLKPGDHTVVVATSKLTVSLGLKVRERALPVRTSKVWSRLPARAHVSTFLTLVGTSEASGRRIHSLTPVVCLGAKYDVVFLNEGRCTVQIKDTKSGKVIKSTTTLVGARAKGEKSVGTRVDPVGPILFDTGTTGLRSPALSTIRTAKKAMSDATSILIVGHSGSALGNTLNNQRLSVDRAMQIRRLLVKGGVTTPISTYGLGALDPVTEMVYEFAQRTNRRVAIYLIP